MNESLTLLLYPFSYTGSETGSPMLQRWHRTDVDIEGGVFHRYIHDKFTGAESLFRSYSLHPGVLPGQLSRLDSTLPGQTPAFRLLDKNGSWLSPRLLLCPDAGVGVLSLAIRMTGSTSDTSLMELNYRLHKLDRQAPVCHMAPPASTPADKMETATSALRKALQPVSPAGDCNWTFPALVRQLLGLPDDTRLEARFHVFTYYQLPSSAGDDKRWQQTFARIVRGQNEAYALSDRRPVSTFDNVHFEASVEGAAMLTFLPPEDKGFFTNFLTSTLCARYLWIYMLILMQRTMQLRLVAGLSDGTAPDDITGAYGRLAYLRANTWYTDISDFTQHNVFYRHCAEALGVDRLFHEIDSKLDVMRTAADLRIEAAQARMDSEIKEIERRQTAVNTALGIIIGLLTVISVTADGVSLLANAEVISSGATSYRVASLVLLFASLALVALAIIIFGLKKKKSHQ